MPSQNKSNDFQKAGTQSADNPFEFIMSTSELDRDGDIVKQNWILSHFKKNPIALYQHNSSQPIGVWENVRVSGGKLTGKLKLAKQGTSEAIDTIRSLVEQGILSAISVGFHSHDRTPVDKKAPWDGLYLNKNELLEASLVSVGANANALITATKSLNLGSDTLDFLSAEIGDTKKAKTSKAHTRVSDKGFQSKATKGDIVMSLATQIKAKQSEIVASRDLIEDIEKSLIDDDRELTDDEMTQIDAMNTDIEASQKQLNALEKMEASRAARIKAIADDGKKEPEVPAMEGARTVSASSKVKGHRAFATMATLVRSHVNKTDIVSEAKTHYGNEAEVVTLAKAATAGALAGTSGWAAELMQETWGEYLEILRDVSIFPGIPGLRLNFDGSSKINVPRNTGRGELAGGFIAENAPIPVKDGTVDSVDLTPKSLKVISTFSREIALRSNPAIESLIRSQLMGDTAEALDTALMDNGAASTTRPAGFQNSTATGAANIITSAGATSANILADTALALGRVLTARLSRQGVWVLHPLRVLGLLDKQDASSGEFVFRDDIRNGIFRGRPFIESSNITATVVAYIANDSVAFASEYAPQIDVSTSASLHYEDTTPLIIGTTATPNTVAAPVRSLFQNDQIALRFTQGLDWKQVRATGVQIIDGCSW